MVSPGLVTQTSPALGDVIGAVATKGAGVVSAGASEPSVSSAAGAPARDLQPAGWSNSTRLDAPVALADACKGISSADAEDLRRQQESLGRRLQDRRLVEELARRDFAGARYRRYEDELARYGLSVMRGWMYTGAIFALVAKRGYGLQPTERELELLHRDSDARSEIANVTVGKALPRFREQAFVGQGWSFEGGASITTYFMGATLSDFPNEFRRWRAQTTRWRLQDHGDYTSNGLHLRTPSDDPADLVAGEMGVLADLERINPRARDIIALTLDGYHQDEIVELLGETSVRAVEGVLHRWRTEEKKRRQRGGATDGFE